MRSSILKRIMILSLSGILALGLFACSSPKENEDGENTSASSESTSVPEASESTPEKSETEHRTESSSCEPEGTNTEADKNEETSSEEGGSFDTDGNSESSDTSAESVTDKVTETKTETETETESETETETETEVIVLEGFEFVESEGAAAVKSPEGLEYVVSGYDKIGKSGFVFEKSMSLTLAEPISASFNRFTIKYRSATALKIVISYTLDGATREDYYFLESGEGTFSGLIPDFLDKKLGEGITDVKIENLEGKAAEFAVIALSSETMSVPERDYYIRGGRYTLGIDLGWGGTINYVSDNLCPIDGVENMINKHDPGRLVQQSYYGTGETEGCDFVWGSFNNNAQWPYNPVQGGGQGRVASRLVDLVIEDNYVYIKAQPMDWGKSDIKYITPSYMENWYIIEDDYIKVDNRFVDFSGWKHPINSQELPAFYTISYLDSFVWYDGVEPWTGDELSWRHELRFWGDSKYSSECSFRIKEPNTETWCAWVSTEDNYGIGLYSPNIDRYSAGRYQYIETLGVSTGTSGSKDASANPTSYVAPWKQKQIVAFEAFEYSYLICAGSVDEIRATFTEHKDVIDNASLSENSVSNRRPFYEEKMESIDLTVEGSEKFVVYPNKTQMSFDKSEGALKLTSNGGDAHVTLDYLASVHLLNAEDYKYIEIVYMIPKTNSLASYSCQLFICAGERKSASEDDSVKGIGLIKDGNYHTLRVRLDDKSFWTGSINLIRFDYFNSSNNGDLLYVRSIRFANEGVSGMDKINFATYEGIDFVSKVNKAEMSFDSEKNATRLVVSGNDPYFVIDYSQNSTELYAKDYSKLRITYMAPTGQSRGNFSYALYPCSGEYKAPSGSVEIYRSTGIIADGEYHTLEIDLSQYAFWDGKINQIRFDFFNAANEGDVFYITSFELVK